MTGDDRFEYNLRAIRELILAAFSAEGLRALVAYDEELGQLRHEFSPGDAIIDMAGKTLALRLCSPGVSGFAQPASCSR